MTAQAERDEWLMAQAALGQKEPFEVLVRRYAQPLVGFLTRMVRDPHDGEELFQETFLSVWRNRANYQFPRSFKPWLYAIAVNVGRRAFRSAGRTMASLEDDAPPIAVGASAEETAIATETATLAAQAIRRLPPQQRAVVALRVWDELSYAEIAGIVGCGEATVRSHMHHGLRAVREALGNYK